ncbi:hypothetical protein DICSQDRAFT_161593 [Dichomitus squalens LYAD-421 SS1]|uniref:RRM domain-containing protein n=1 Tax=Dichomitus squalens (strain LYAD-421) TaxID=732165 RepID=R7SZG3_DICSQ|nr:uncharacterized protein DICSQDRAFT_161593 [Dichomitus squalens LYAD-421 SS1]EJF61110.1 hypothetical protein DICSQDRAFT_161593 [Dichomitus squalens LYAD-421 SS1]
MSSSTSGSSSDSEQRISAPDQPRKRKRLSEDEDDHDSDSQSESDDSDSSHDTEPDAEEEEPVLSRAERRRQKKKEERAAKKSATVANGDGSKKGKEKVQNTADLPPSKVSKRQNSVWVGNLSFKTTPALLRSFFEGVGEITRIHMPTKMAHGGPDGKPRKENRGFAYVDFATPDAKAVAITMSEKPLEGRRLLIKDGDDFAGRPATAATDGAEAPGGAKTTGLTKTAQKILSVQKQPPGPTLFLGNLGFDTTEDSIRELLVSHRATDPLAEDKWIRKIRLGTFEDSGKCKGWAFVDFTATEHATSALTNPRNHHLNGRKLVVEYASPEAVRRGGGGAPREKKPKEVGQGMKRERPARKTKDDTEKEVGGKEAERPMKKRRSEGGEEGKPRGKERRVARSKPGAALAMAKREDPSIVPSQGKKIVF